MEWWGLTRREQAPIGGERALSILRDRVLGGSSSKRGGVGLLRAGPARGRACDAGVILQPVVKCKAAGQPNPYQVVDAMVQV